MWSKEDVHEPVLTLTLFIYFIWAQNDNFLCLEPETESEPLFFWPGADPI